MSVEPTAVREPRGITLARSSFWIAFDSVTGSVGSLIASVAVARVLGPEKLGHYAYIMWIANTARLLGCAGLSVGVRKYAGEFLGRGEPASARAVVRQAYRWQLTVAIPLVTASLLLALSVVQPEHRAFTALALLSLLPSLLLGVSAGAVEATQDFGANVQSSIVGNFTNLAGVALALIQGWGMTGLAAALLASRVVDAILRHLTYRRVYGRLLPAAVVEPPGALDKGTTRRMLDFTWQVTLLAAINAVLWDRSEFLFLERFREVRELAFYSLGFGLSQQVLTVPQVFASAAGANLFAEQGRDPSSLGRVATVVTRYVALLAFPLTFGLAALSSPAIHLLYGSSYGPAAPALLILALGAAPVAFLASAQHVLMATERQGLLLRWTVGVAAVNVLLDFLLVRQWGATGGALGKALSQTLAVAGMWLFISRALGFRPPRRALLLTALAAVPSAGLAAVCGLVLSPVAAVLVGVPTGALA